MERVTERERFKIDGDRLMIEREREIEGRQMNAGREKKRDIERDGINRRD